MATIKQYRVATDNTLLETAMGAYKPLAKCLVQREMLMNDISEKLANINTATDVMIIKHQSELLERVANEMNEMLTSGTFNSNVEVVVAVSVATMSTYELLNKVQCELNHVDVLKGAAVK